MPRPMKLDEEAVQSLQKADELRKLGISLIPDESSNEILKRALREYLTAYWILQDQRTEIFRTMLKIGKKICDEFGCPIEFNGSNYIMSCPVRLSQINIGLSIGGTQDYNCSICGRDPIYCDHIAIQKYDNVPCRRIRGICNICANEGECNHIEGEYYDNVEAFKIRSNVEPDHISFVTEPNYPLSRIFAFTIDIDTILNSLPEEQRERFEYGKHTVFCNYCIVYDDATKMTS